MSPAPSEAAAAPGRLARLVFFADLAGTFLFALQGALLAVRADLDPVGMLVLAFSTALVGGLIRDVLIGALPPIALKDWRLASTAFLAAAIVFLLGSHALRLPMLPIIVLDAAALGLFAVAGTIKAHGAGLNPLAAALLGTVTGVGGGVVRDILLARVPLILHSEIYATAAFAGAVLVVAGLRRGLALVPVALAGGLLCFTIRLLAVWQGWNLPRMPY